jgi:hypothetical protein
MEKIISEYEELLKVKEFHKEKKSMPLECTYQSILKTLQADFDNNIKDKLDRWITISNARYFQYSTPVINYFQAKMLFRDGYYEAAITFSRAICEMICYDYLSKQVHPFGSYENLENENFRTLVKFLAIPKSIPKGTFEDEIISKIVVQEDRNFMASSYSLDNADNVYKFKISNGKIAKNLNRFHQIFSEVDYIPKDNFPSDTYSLINEVYDNGNTYVHARKSPNPPKQDAINSLNKIGKVLAYLYIVDGELTGKAIVSGYTEFPDICSGIHFSMDAYATPEDAMRGYYNLPSEKQFENMLALNGVWEGEWKNSKSNRQAATFRFSVNDEFLTAQFESIEPSIIGDVAIKLFGEYFHILVYDKSQSGKKRKPIFHFELEFLNNNMVIGSNLLNSSRVLLIRK